jgi:2C-methyl-D-erythritol 2,4-cyclodiphosphate synthase
MRERGYAIGNIDCTIIAQRPKMSPHKEAIRDNLCQMLGAHPRWGGCRDTHLRSTAHVQGCPPCSWPRN